MKNGVDINFPHQNQAGRQERLPVVSLHEFLHIVWRKCSERVALPILEVYEEVGITHTAEARTWDNNAIYKAIDVLILRRERINCLHSTPPKGLIINYSQQDIRRAS